MKRLINKFRDALEREYEIPLPKKPGVKKPTQHIPSPQQQTQRPGYVNPFKHQQDLEQQRLQARIAENQRRIEDVKKAALAKLHPPTKPVQPRQQTPPPTPAPTQQKQMKKPSIFDRKLEITIKKPTFKKPTITLPTFPKRAPTPHVPEPTKPTLHVAPPKKPEITTPIPKELPKIELPKHANQPPKVAPKKPTITLPKIPRPHMQIKPKKKHGYVFAVVVGGALVIGAFASGALKNPLAPTGPTAQETAHAQQETPPAVKLAEAVGKKTDLPKEEEPVSATVSDSTKLQSQEFFQEAKNGDKILMYKKAKKAYLYRPATDEVIAIAPLEFRDTAGASTTAEDTQTPEPTTDPNAPKTSIVPEPPHGKVLVPAKY